ncbi:MAG TPA: MmcQ/YjbR family DNA-binding protein, partial [Pilimelia sp.]|nr:MmcQ/YjbR family DNA-binding protein [Pilimelia sp.]
DRMTLRLTPQEQAAVLAEDPETFSAKGHWGRLGWTFVNLPTVDPEQLRELITEAWRGKAPKRLVAEFDDVAG